MKAIRMDGVINGKYKFHDNGARYFNYDGLTIVGPERDGNDPENRLGDLMNSADDFMKGDRRKYESDK